MAIKRETKRTSLIQIINEAHLLLVRPPRNSMITFACSFQIHIYRKAVEMMLLCMGLCMKPETTIANEFN